MSVPQLVVEGVDLDAEAVLLRQELRLPGLSPAPQVAAGAARPFVVVAAQLRHDQHAIANQQARAWRKNAWGEDWWCTTMAATTS
jgi:hypothetical protein